MEIDGIKIDLNSKDDTLTSLKERLLKTAGLAADAPRLLRVMQWVIIVLSCIVTLSILYMLFNGTVSETRTRTFTLGVFMFIGYLWDPIKRHKKKGKYSLIYTLIAIALGLFGAFVNAYLFFMDIRLVSFLGIPTTFQIVIGTGLLIVVMDLTRRYCGPALPIVALIAIFYTLFGEYMPAGIMHKGYGFNRIVSTMVISKNGVYGDPMSIASTYVVLFVIFGAALQSSGAGQTFIKVVTGLCGQYRGGPAKMAVVASCLFGTISGSPVANVVSTGSFTIPLMIASGYKNHFAGAVEAVASTGGQVMPPVMGAVAFLIAEFLGITYAEVIVAAIVPALLYYFSLFMMVDFEAWRLNLPSLRKDQLPIVREIMRKEGQLLLPLLVLLLCLLVFKVSAASSALYAIVSVMVVAMFSKKTWWTVEKLIDIGIDTGNNMVQITLACGTAGIVIGAFGLTGLGIKFSSFLVGLAGGNLFILLVLAAVACIILGMGMPSVGVYVILSVLVAPAIINMGVDKMPAHMFILFYGNLACITPPVAMAAYAGAVISQSSPMKVGFTACRIGIVAFITPFCFVYQPAILLMGDSVFSMIACITTAAIGCVCLAVAFEGYKIRGKLWFLVRLLFGAAGIMLLMPDHLTDLFALACIVLGLFLEKLFKGKSSPPSDAKKDDKEIEAPPILAAKLGETS